MQKTIFFNNQVMWFSPLIVIKIRVFFQPTAQFQYIKIQPTTIDLSIKLRGINPTNSSYSPEPRAEVYCFRLNFNISKLVYSVTKSTKLGPCGPKRIDRSIDVQDLSSN